MYVRLPKLKTREKISLEEYQRLKRQLLSLRREYAARVFGSQADRRYVAIHSEQGQELERRISELELRLTYSYIEFPEGEPLTVRVTEAVQDMWATFSEAFAGWYGQTAIRLSVLLRQRQSA
jgi:hypothetical protein